jgi:hypothetical protein
MPIISPVREFAVRLWVAGAARGPGKMRIFPVFLSFLLFFYFKMGIIIVIGGLMPPASCCAAGRPDDEIVSNRCGMSSVFSGFQLLESDKFELFAECGLFIARV